MQAPSFKLTEIFYSLQGEGMYTGTAAVFVRLSGCLMGCSFCDTDFKENFVMTSEEIIKEVKKYPSKIVIITGGEPAEQDICALIKSLKQAGLKVHIETNGSIYFDAQGVDNLTVSPKTYVDPNMLKSAHVIKIVVGQDTDISDLKKYFNYASEGRLIYLQPESNKQENIDLCVKLIKENPFLRLSLQTHKFAKIP
ncbi:Putative 6- pyruvoyltetrahydropterin 2-reductase [Elusimicrobium minutum Pei191]|uniref:7-carboxy-7-deazaguanine synthase n=2 Tax=Elusimicrobium TaxID=423604 RepID=B2KC63_ELUMP|nr:Putative 6- pyruvoyltetrahydropterin 2-reductase [Elusimicrobium minutum Pei191]